ncbi:MAG: hypothetical protein GY940_03145 [bacterium]|nr:hypothetical protein [bacterium]
MKTYEEFLVFLEEHLNHMTDFVPATSSDFHPVCFATARFLLSEPYRWETLMIDWPKLPQVEKPAESQLLDFFKSTKGMPLSFRKELKEKNLDTLYKAYNLLYPICVTKDEFLTSVFRDDISARRYKKIFKQSEKKLDRVTGTINVMKKDKSFIQLMQQFTKDLSGFSLTLINNNKLLDQVVKKMMGAAAN